MITAATPVGTLARVVDDGLGTMRRARPSELGRIGRIVFHHTNVGGGYACLEFHDGKGESDVPYDSLRRRRWHPVTNVELHTTGEFNAYYHQHLEVVALADDDNALQE